MYPCQLVGEDAQIMIDIVNQGIDSHLEAVTDSKFQWKYHLTDGSEVNPEDLTPVMIDIKQPPMVLCSKLHCEISLPDLAVIIGRMLESEDNDTEMLAESILNTLGIEDCFITRTDTVSYAMGNDSGIIENKYADSVLDMLLAENGK
jgi:hypothetical protein